MYVYMHIVTVWQRGFSYGRNCLELTDKPSDGHLHARSTMVYVRPDEARCRGAGYPCNAPGIAVPIPAISTITLKFQFSALAQTHPEQKRSQPRLERTLETCTLENCAMDF